MQQMLGLPFGAEGGALRSGYEDVHTQLQIAAHYCLPCSWQRRYS